MEALRGYADDQEKQEKLYWISHKPKHHDIVPERFDQLIELVNKGVLLDTACEKLEMKIMTGIDLERYKIKYNDEQPAKSII